ncbi:hypothetical protein F0L74_24475 [Chitinophaga agrisoli]|uniref:Uncharacterized protein n=1 Tax=Chitinophaga agrisoli TaxID=2607653 RepID=A0A5B2VM23_9BACT|nr:hypothetical protein [Chitinophaga agrisoli]KAA2239362.1 hypothetical protein F0L74_24475 [Chitinophaga agrisoli]
MKLRSPLVLLLLLGATMAGVFVACHKEANAPGKKDSGASRVFTVKEARRHFYKEVRPAMKQQVRPTGPVKLYPVWDKAQTFQGSDCQIIEVPVYFEKRQIMAIRLAPQGDTIARTTGPGKQELANFDRLVFYKFADGSITEKLVTYMPETNYMARHQYDASQNTLWALDKDFSGYLVQRTLDGKPILAYKVKNAKMVSRLDFNKVVREEARKKNARWVETCTTESVIISWEQQCIKVMVDEPDGSMHEGDECVDVIVLNVYEVCTTTWEDDKPDCLITPSAPGCPTGPYSPGGGGSDDPEEGVDPVPYMVSTPSASYPIENISQYLAPFDLSQTVPGKVTIYVAQPVWGSRIGSSGAYLGGTFITLEQTVNGRIVRRSVGVFPSHSVNTDHPVAPAQLGNTEWYYYTIKLDGDIDGHQFVRIYDLIYEAGTGTFDIGDTNDHYLGYLVAQEAFGFSLTRENMPYPPFLVWTAGNLAEDLREAGGVYTPSPFANPEPNMN